jgi:hypothetical protein
MVIKHCLIGRSDETLPRASKKGKKKQTKVEEESEEEDREERLRRLCKEGKLEELRKELFVNGIGEFQKQLTNPRKILHIF